MTTYDSKRDAPIGTTPCGRIGCIAVYSSRECHMCEYIEEIVRQAVRAEGIPEDIVKRIPEEIPIEDTPFDSVYAFPSVRVCDGILNGIPTETEIRNALRNANHLQCFLKTD